MSERIKELAEQAEEWNADGDKCEVNLQKFAELIIAECAKLCEPAAQPEQEPLEYWNAVEGWVKIDEVRKHFDSVGCGTIYKTAGEGRAPLYTSPPKREWVGLTDDERRVCTQSPFTEENYRAIEAKLKELNHD